MQDGWRLARKVRQRREDEACISQAFCLAERICFGTAAMFLEILEARMLK